MGEIEVISFQAAASVAPGATLGFFGVLALFDPGLMPISLDRRQAGRPQPFGTRWNRRLAEAVARGGACNTARG